jgi:alkylhydroperoxidase/carboxymuconolactone decarboxylase family protein YurZ
MHKAPLTYEQGTCPICGSVSDTFLIDKPNLSFLVDLANEDKINAVISMTKIIWDNVPQLRLTADSKLVIDELSKTLLENTQRQINGILEPISTFTATFPKLIEKLPQNLREDVKEEFQETRTKLESGFKTLREVTPTFKDTLAAIQAITDKLHEVTERKMDEIKRELASNFKETLQRMGFPEPDQMKLLSQLIPSTLPLLEELLRFQKVPKEKGERGELDLFQELREFYPEDECEHLGGSGEIDILAIPRFNGSNLGHKILVESKKNSSGWDRSFIHQVRNQMQLRGERFAILAVEVMPKTANGFLIENCPEGVVLVTDREYFKISYGAVRSAMIALHPFCHKEIDFRKLFADQKINQAIKDAYDYCDWVKKIRYKARRIETTAQGVTEDIKQLDMHLKQALRELQAKINEAILQITTTENDEAPLGNEVQSKGFSTDGLET